MPPAVCPDGSPKMTSAIDSQRKSQPEPAGSPGTSVLNELTTIRRGSDGRRLARQEVRHDQQLVIVEDAGIETPDQREPDEEQALEFSVAE